jgi:hypothetical protein
MLAPKGAISLIKKEEPSFWKLLERLRYAIGKDSVLAAKKAVKQLK